MDNVTLFTTNIYKLCTLYGKYTIELGTSFYQETVCKTEDRQLYQNANIA